MQFVIYPEAPVPKVEVILKVANGERGIEKETGTVEAIEPVTIGI